MAVKNKPNKPFKSYRQQLKILRARNLKIENGSFAIDILKRNNYYNLINGYKDIFLEETGKDEKFYDGTTFEHINALSEFDKEIRHLFLYHILSFETLIKTKISYYHTEEYNEIFNYLDINHFDGKPEEITKLIATISKEIESHTNTRKPNNFSHYIKKHGELPLWVLFQKSTFGTSSYFFANLLPKLKNVICKELKSEYSKRYKNADSSIITSEFLETAIQFINNYRNICAHNERMFMVTYKNKGSIFNYSKYVKYEFRGSVFDLMIILKLFLIKKDFEKLKKNFKKYLGKLEKDLIMNKVAFKKIKDGNLRVPNNWEEILNKIWEDK